MNASIQNIEWTSILFIQVWTETSSGDGATNYLTGMGGFLQVVMFGYGGFRLLLESLYFNATIPPESTSLDILDLDYMGSRFNLRFSMFEMTIEVLELDRNYPLEVELFDDDITVRLEMGKLFSSNAPLKLENIKFCKVL